MHRCMHQTRAGGRCAAGSADMSKQLRVAHDVGVRSILLVLPRVLKRLHALVVVATSCRLLPRLREQPMHRFLAIPAILCVSCAKSEVPVAARPSINAPAASANARSAHADSDLPVAANVEPLVDGVPLIVLDRDRVLVDD